MSHPLVQEVVTVRKGDFKVQRPKKLVNWRNILEPKWDVRFLVVANTAGLKHFQKHNLLQGGFLQAASELGHNANCETERLRKHS